MKKTLLLMCLTAAAAVLCGAEPNIKLRNQEFMLWEKPEAVPHSIPEDSKLTPVFRTGRHGSTRVNGINSPSVIYFPANDNRKKPAIVVCPGGGHKYLSIESEGIYICNYLNHLGYSAFLLKYRTMGRKRTECGFADAARAIRFVRHNAEKFSVDPEKVGIIGFSAGGHVAAFVSAPGKEPYQAADEADKQSFRPDFSMLIYPAYLAGRDLQLKPEFKADAKMPPTFIVQTQDDFVGAENAVAWFLAMKKAKAQAEVHLFARGRHGYGVKRGGLPVYKWPALLEKWLESWAPVK